MKGFAKLQTPRDLLSKLEADLQALENSPGDTYLAFNLFVTAEHMLDWLYPGDSWSDNGRRRKTERDGEVLLKIVSHVANGAKHFEVNPKWHDSVTHVDHVDTPFGGGTYGAGPFGGGLTIDLDGDAAATYGHSTTALDLARHVVQFWRLHPGIV